MRYVFLLCLTLATRSNGTSATLSKFHFPLASFSSSSSTPPSSPTASAFVKLPSVSLPISSLPPASAYNRPLHFWENMICGAVSRSVSQTIMHPANTMKTILQSRTSSSHAASIGLAEGSKVTLRQLMKFKNLKLLTRGAGAQFCLSVPHGAVNFATLEYTRRLLSKHVAAKYAGPGLDFLSSGIATFICSTVSTPQMMITDNIMAGTYSNLFTAVKGLSGSKGIGGFYTGWLPGITGKIPSYGMTWVFFQQLKEFQVSQNRERSHNREWSHNHAHTHSKN